MNLNDAGYCSPFIKDPSHIFYAELDDATHADVLIYILRKSLHFLSRRIFDIEAFRTAKYYRYEKSVYNYENCYNTFNMQLFKKQYYIVN